MTDIGMLPLGPAPPKDLTVAEVRRRYLEHAGQYYRRPDGTSTGEAENARRALAALDALAELPAADFGPRALKAIRLTMIERGLARSTINARVNIIRRAWKWAVSEELLPEIAHVGLTAVDGLRAGRSAARETAPVGPLDEARVDATLRFLPPSVQAMVRLQLLTAMRPGEICGLRPCDLEARGPVWFYRPAQHKTLYRGRTRVIPIGPRAQQVLEPFLKGPLDASCFSPRQAEKERRDRRGRLARRPRRRRDLVRARRCLRHDPGRVRGRLFDVLTRKRARREQPA